MTPQVPPWTESGRWRAAAEAAGVTGLVERKNVMGWVIGIGGRCGPLTVELAFVDGKFGWAPSIRVGGLLPGLSLHREKPSPVTRLDTQTGDELFDGEVEVHGPDVPLRALLDAETRRVVRRLLAGSVEVARETPTRAPQVAFSVGGGELRAILFEEALSEADESVASALRTLLSAGLRLVRPEDIPARLARNAGSDPEWNVRLRNLQVLIHGFADHPATREALRAACGDQMEAIRLRAAIALPGEGRRVLLEIATAENSDDPGAGQAITALGKELPRATALETLARALRRRRLRSAQACIAWLGRHGEAGDVETLARVLAIEQGELAVAAAKALGASGRPAAEPALVRALASDQAEVRVAAAEALGGLGSAAAVLPLREAAAQHAGDGALQRASRQAIAEIQSRLTGSPGQLSLAASEAGQLTLAEDASGQLTLTPGDSPKTDG
jgi:HEAT repeat protein